MAYADRKMSSNRIVALVIVMLIHALLGYAFITGLAYKAIKEVNKDLNVFDVTEEPPPPPEEDPPPPPPDQPQQPAAPPVVVPPTPFRIQSPNTVQSTPTIPPSAPIVYQPLPPSPAPAPPPPPPPPPPPAAPVVSQAARANGSLPGLIDGEADYPDAARRNEEQGTVRARLDIGTNGRVTSCSVTKSSGSSSLDSTTCRILKARARFTPAKDQNGNNIADSVVTPGITWRLTE